MANRVADSIPPITPVPTAFCAPLPAPLLMTRGITPRMNAREVIRIGFKRGFDNPFAFFIHEILGELNDQYGVLG